MNAVVSAVSEKERHPEKYCPTKRCLWRTGGGACPRHKLSPVRELLAVIETITAMHKAGSQNLQRILELEYRRQELEREIGGAA